MVTNDTYHIKRSRNCTYLNKQMPQVLRGLHVRNGLEDIVLDSKLAEWLRAWDTLTMFEATVCGTS